MDQSSFERGLEIGLRTALVITRRGEGADGIQAQIDELKESQVARANGGIVAGRSVVDGDIFISLPLAHPGDFGMPIDHTATERSLLSRLEWNNQPASPILEQESCNRPRDF